MSKTIDQSKTDNNVGCASNNGSSSPREETAGDDNTPKTLRTTNKTNVRKPSNTADRRLVDPLDAVPGLSGLCISQDEEIIKITSPKRRQGNFLRVCEENTEACGDVVTANGCVLAVRKTSTGTVVQSPESTESGTDKDMPWQSIGLYQHLKETKCRRLYARKGREHDLAMFIVNGRLYVMDAWCSHMGGPLFQGEIEDYNGRCHVMCPWHSFMFDLNTGKNELGLKQEVYAMKYEKGEVFVRYHSELSLRPFHKDSVVSIAPDRH